MLRITLGSLMAALLISLAGFYAAWAQLQRMRRNTGRIATLWMLTGSFTLGLAVLLAAGVSDLLSAIPVWLASLSCFMLMRTRIGAYRIALCALIMTAGVMLMHVFPQRQGWMLSLEPMHAPVWFLLGILASIYDRAIEKQHARKLESLEREYLNRMSDTERHAREMTHSLRESEMRSRMTLRHSPDAVFICKRDGSIVYVNDAMLKILGYSRKSLYEMTIFDLVPEDWKERYRQEAKGILADRNRHVREIRLLSKNGAKIPMELNVALLPDGTVYGACRDITERKLAQRALQDAQENLQRLLDSVAEGIYGVDNDGVCTFVNAAFLRMLGYADAGEIVGRVTHGLIHHSHADGSRYPADSCRVYQVFREKMASHVDDEVFWRKDGTPVAVEYWSHPIIRNGQVLGAVTTFLDITERKAAEQKIHQLAFFDELTGLPNRRLLMDRLHQAVAASDRNGFYAALMFLDLDDFKKLNDSRGHDMGDMLLAEVARRLQGCVRDGDSVARLGGDEFVIVFEMLSEQVNVAVLQAELVSEKIRAALSAPYQLNQYAHHTTSSIGIVLFRGHEENIDNLLKFADTAMYQAKAAGRNAIRFYDPDMQATLEARIQMETELRSALKDEQFCLHYQLQVDGKRRPIGAEVLLRWVHPERGLISPADFIPLCEETGLILPVGLWVIERACEQLKRWEQDEPARDLVLAVNVSSIQFRQADFVDQVARVLKETGADPSRLKLELTESVLLQHVEETISKMREINGLGVGFSIDDFGTGYSSLQYLKRLPLDQIKIDQSFVRDITTDPNDAAIVQTVIAMTEAMGLEVIAEGVETQAQFEFLDLRGCNAFQGYLFGRPLPMEEFELLFKRC